MKIKKLLALEANYCGSLLAQPISPPFNLNLL